MHPKQYEAVTVPLTRRPQVDDAALTRLLNERSAAGFAPAMIALGAERAAVIFERAVAVSRNGAGAIDFLARYFDRK